MEDLQFTTILLKKPSKIWYLTLNYVYPPFILTLALIGDWFLIQQLRLLYLLHTFFTNVHRTYIQLPMDYHC